MSASSLKTTTENGSASMGRRSPVNGHAGSSSLHPNGVAKRARSSRRKTPQPDAPPQPLTINSITKYIVDHQISLCAIPIATLATLHFSSPVGSSLHQFTTKFLSLCYFNPQTGLYGKGLDDTYLIVFWIVMLTLLRACLMDYAVKPWAKSQGMTKKGSIRFAEQGWSFFYYTISFALGIKLMINSKYWFNLAEVWTDWPIRETEGALKWYYLVQFSSWMQQIFILNIEERRKDHYQMLAHHIITCILVYCSYVYHMMRIGHVILCLFDFGDILLPSAKMLKYLKYQKPCDAMFGLFLVSWFIGRHIFYLLILRSAHIDLPREIPFGCYSSDLSSFQPLTADTPPSSTFFLNPKQTICFTHSIQWTFLGFLWALQGLTCVWFYMIMRVAVKVVMGVGAEDVRSDDEEEEEVDDVNVEIELLNGDLKLISAEAYAEASGSSMNGSARRRREGINGTPLRDVFNASKHSQSQFSAAQKLAESKIGCGGDDR